MEVLSDTPENPLGLLVSLPLLVAFYFHLIIRINNPEPVSNPTICL